MGIVDSILRQINERKFENLPKNSIKEVLRFLIIFRNIRFQNNLKKNLSKFQPNNSSINPEALFMQDYKASSSVKRGEKGSLS